VFTADTRRIDNLPRIIELYTIYQVFARYFFGQLVFLKYYLFGGCHHFITSKMPSGVRNEATMEPAQEITSSLFSTKGTSVSDAYAAQDGCFFSFYKYYKN